MYVCMCVCVKMSGVVLWSYMDGDGLCAVDLCGAKQTVRIWNSARAMLAFGKRFTKVR